jgi:hypothetical protein
LLACGRLVKPNGETSMWRQSLKHPELAFKIFRLDAAHLQCCFQFVTPMQRWPGECSPGRT